MAKFAAYTASAPLNHAVRCNGIRDRVLLGMVLFALVPTGDAMAGDQPSVINLAQEPDAGKPRRSSPPTTATMERLQLFSAPALSDNQGFSSTEFRRRQHTVVDIDPGKPWGDAPMLRGTTGWQRMSEYKSHDRVRVLTLWESTGGTISLQAGKHGDPSLQWTSRLMNRGGATQGLLDRFFSASLARAGSLRNTNRPTSAGAPKQTSLPVSVDRK